MIIEAICTIKNNWKIIDNINGHESVKYVDNFNQVFDYIENLKTYLTDHGMGSDKVELKIRY